MMRNFIKNQYINEISSALRELKPMLAPRSGWIKTIREALGMTSTQLAHRLETSPSRITRIEDDELRHALTLETLQNVAQALECDLVYALVPKQNIADILKERALTIAKSRLQRLQNTMALEDQALDSEQFRMTLEHHVDQLLHGPLKYLWEDDNNNENDTQSRGHAT
jgi:predicted DNA-binding mobile mystery protein A